MAPLHVDRGSLPRVCLWSADRLDVQDSAPAPTKTPTPAPEVTEIASASAEFEPLTQNELHILTGNVQRPNGIGLFNNNLYVAVLVTARSTRSIPRAA